MLITVYFAEDGLPKTGLSPTLDIIDLSDGSVVINDGAMTDRGSGFYTYDFAGYDAGKDYSVICDSVTLAGSERYAIAEIESYLGTDGNILISANAQDLSATLDVNAKTFESTLDLTATMKTSVNTEADAALSGYGANTVVPDAAGVVPTAVEIRQEMDSNSVDLNTIIAYVNELESRLTAARGGYLDKLNVTGALAHSDAAATYKADVNNLDVAVSSRAPETGGNIAAIKAKTDNLPSGIPKNVALSDFEFVMVDSADGKTPKTGLTVACRVSLDGAAFQNSTNAAAEIGSGLYKIDFTQAERNATVATYEFTATGADDRLVTIISPA